MNNGEAGRIMVTCVYLDLVEDGDSGLVDFLAWV